MIYWFTGQPSHGKTVLASMLKETFKDNKVFHIDGDDLRALTLNKDYSKQGRLDNVRGAQKIAHYLHNEGYTVVVSLVSPYRDQREQLKKALLTDALELYIHTSEPRERDCYRVEDYEPPLENFISIDTTIDTPEQSLKKILKNVK
jgi:adenylylsulfate kinase-like enzyme